MMNEELKAVYESLNSMEDAYALMKENGYTGTMEDFEALCVKAAEEIGPMDLDAMDAVAGGVSWDGIKEGASEALNKTWNWMKENPALTAGIVGGVAVAAIGITVGVKAYRRSNAITDDAMSVASRNSYTSNSSSSSSHSSGGENLLLTEEEPELEWPFA